LAKIRLMWVFTVALLTKRRWAISELLRPEASRARTSASRGGEPGRQFLVADTAFSRVRRATDN
jgi:hypothetical protein